MLAWAKRRQGGAGRAQKMKDWRAKHDEWDRVFDLGVVLLLCIAGAALTALAAAELLIGP